MCFSFVFLSYLLYVAPFGTSNDFEAAIRDVYFFGKEGTNIAIHDALFCFGQGRRKEMVNLQYEDESSIWLIIRVVRHGKKKMMQLKKNTNRVGEKRDAEKTDGMAVTAKRNRKISVSGSELSRVFQ